MKIGLRAACAMLVAGFFAFGSGAAALATSTTSYQVLVETREDATAPFEVFLASFLTLDDLFAGITGPPTGFTEIAITPDFQIAGFSSVTTVTPPPPGVPEPATWSLMIIGIGGIGIAMRRRQRGVAA